VNYLRGYDYVRRRATTTVAIACRDQSPDAPRNCIFVFGVEGAATVADAERPPSSGRLDADQATGDERPNEGKRDCVYAD